MLDVLLDPNNIFIWIILILIIIGAIAVISRPFSTYIKFVYPNAKFEAIGNPYISEKELNRIIESKDLNGFKEILNSLKDYNLEGKDVYFIQKSLDDHFLKTIDMMQKDSSKKMNNFFSKYLEKLDFYLIKNTIKIKLFGRTIDTNLINQGFLPHTKKLLNEIVEADIDGLKKILKDNGFEDELIDTISGEEIDIISIDLAFDKHIFKKLDEVKVPYKCDNAKKQFVSTLIDLTNIKNILRAKQIGYDAESCKKLFVGDGHEIASWKFKELAESDTVSQVIARLEGTSYFNPLKDSIEDYNKENSVQILENSLDSHFLNLIKNISIQNYATIGPTIRFLVSKEFEIKNLKAIVKGISEGLSIEVIKKVLIKEVSA